jgi:ubiquinone/menaquinone biosynthesis C-methylase UbiE
MPDRRQQQELVREQFTKTAEVFGNFAVATRGAEAATLAEMVRVSKSDRVVDVACGAGTLALRFARQAKWVYGADLTPAIMARAKNTAAAEKLWNMDFLLTDAHRLPFADGSLDIAISSYALHHMPDAPRAIAEMARAVRPGGRVGIVDIYVSETPEAAQLNDRIERIRDASHTRTLTRGEFERIFEVNRLRVTGLRFEDHRRQFDHWLHVAGWHAGDAPYEAARRLMESTLENDRAGFHPRIEPAEPGAQAELMMTNTVLLIAGEKL